MTTTPTTSPEAEALPTLPVVAWRDQTFEDFAADFGAEFAIRSCGTTYADAQTHAMWCCWRETQAPAEAAIVALRAEVAELRKERDAAMAEVQELAWHRDPWISAADQVPQGREPVIVISRGWDKPKVLSYEIRILKDGPWERFIDNDTGRWYWYPERMHWMHLADYDDLKEDGAALLGDGGTL